MTVFAGFDVHRAQITFDALDSDTGEVTRGRIDSTPAAVERWVTRFSGREIHVAVEACTGWLFVCQALERSGACPQLRHKRAQDSACLGHSFGPSEIVEEPDALVCQPGKRQIIVMKQSEKSVQLDH